MNCQKVMSFLYGENKFLTLSIINTSKYVKEIEISDEQIMHTGFVFQIHTGKSFEILYDLNTQKIIKQVRNKEINLPCIAGLVCKKQGDYFNEYLSQIITELSICNNDLLLSEHYDILDNDHLKTNEFKFFIIDTIPKIYHSQFPLNRIFDTQLYFDGQKHYLSKPQTKIRYSENEDEYLDFDNINENREYDRDNFYALTGGQFGSYDDYEGDSDDIYRSLGRD